MKVTKILATQTESNEKINFVFGNITQNRAVVMTKGSVLNKLLRYAFCDEKMPKEYDIEVDFVMDGKLHSLKKENSQEQVGKTLRVKDNEGNIETVAEGVEEVNLYINKHLGVNVAELLTNAFVSDLLFEKFQDNFNLSYFGKMADVEASFVRNLDGKTVPSDAQLDQPVQTVTQAQLDECDSSISILQDRIQELKHSEQSLDEQNESVQSSTATSQDDKKVELERLQKQLDKLNSRRSFIQSKQKQLVDYDNVVKLIDPLKKLADLKKQSKQLLDSSKETQKELEWRQSEYNNLNKQIEDKQKEYNAALSNRIKMQAIQSEMGRKDELVATNVTLNGNLSKLKEQIDILQAQKITLKNNLNTVEESIADIKSGLEQLNVPKKTAGEMLESIKINVKLDEIETQVEKLRSEIVVKETQITDKESALAVTNKQVRAIMDMDSAVAPYKAREALMTVLDTKSNKIRLINKTLQTKQRNLERALEGYNFDLSSVTNSILCKNAELEALKQKKADEFKRQVLINSQKMYQDATAIFAVDSNLSDAEVLTCVAEINARVAEKEQLIALTSKITGELAEIKRAVEINEAEILSLNSEKDNIIARYNQMLNENTNDTVYSYLRALETDKGTKYLLDISSSSTRMQTEIDDLKKNVETSRLRLLELQTRYKNLVDSRNMVDSENATIEFMLNASEQTKNEINDITTRLNAGYERHKAILANIDELDMKILRVQELLVETNKTIRVNEHEISVANDRASKIVGQDIEQLSQQAQALENDLLNDLNALNANKAEVESKIFTGKLDLEKAKWLAQSKDSEHQALYDTLKQSFLDNNVSIEWAESVADLSDEDMNATRSTVNEYNDTVKSLENRIAALTSGEQHQTVEVPVQDNTARRTEIETEIQSLTKQLQVQQKAQKKLSAEFARYNVQLEQYQAQSQVAVTVANTEIPLQLKQYIEKANTYLSKMTSGVKLNYNQTLEVYLDDNFTSIKAIEYQQQVYVFMALLMALPLRSNEKNDFLVIDERLECDKQRMTNALSDIDDYIFVTGYAYKKQKGDNK